MSKSVKIKVKKCHSKFVAIDTSDNARVIAEGTTVNSVVRKAEKTGKPFSMMFIPKKGHTYIY